MMPASGMMPGEAGDDDPKARLLSSLRHDAIKLLIAAAADRPYSEALETQIRQWATTFGVAADQIDQLFVAAANSALDVPNARRPLPAPPAALASSPHLQPAAGAHRGSGGGATPYAVVRPPNGAWAHTAPAVSAGEASPSGWEEQHGLQEQQDPAHSYAIVGPAIGRKVLRNWSHDPKAVARNKGNPWFSAVVTDYQPHRGAGTHTLTYNFMRGERSEEAELISLHEQSLHSCKLGPQGETLDLAQMFMNPKLRAKSPALQTSKFLRAMCGASSQATGDSSAMTGGSDWGGEVGSKPKSKKGSSSKKARMYS